MIGSRLTQQVLIIAGAVALAMTIVAALIVVGGPAHARAERIDHWRLAAIAGALHLVDCAHQLTGDAPETLAAARALIVRSHAKLHNTSCQPYDPIQFAEEQDKIEYVRLTASLVRVCNTFLRADLEPPMINDPGYPDVIYMNGPFGFTALNVPRTKAGRFCYDIDLPARAL